MGKTVKVKVSFTDNLSGVEERTSAAYPSSGTVTAAAGTNTPPTSADEKVEADEDIDYTFASADFAFTDTDAGDSLVSVKIVTLPASGTGTLTLSGTAIGSGDLPKTVLAAEIDDLKYSPPANLYGTDVASFTFKVNDGTVDSDNAYTITIDVKGEDDSATGKPGITGTAQVGQTLTATVGTIADADGVPDPLFSAAATTVQWIQVDGVNESDISGATSETYTLATADAGKTIKVKVSFEDEDGGAEGPLTSDTYPSSGTVMAAGGTNTAPVFANDTTSRSFTETVGDAEVVDQGEVGAAVTATDADGDTLTYSLEGTDAAKFGIDSGSGQIQTKVGEKYDREAKASYSVTVKADDSNGGSDTIAVTINVDNEVEKPVAPAIPTVTATSGSTTSLDVSWPAPANTGRPPITGYKVEYRPGVSGNWLTHAHTGTGTTATIASLTAATSYQVQVLAVNSDGDGAFSSPGAGTTGTVRTQHRPGVQFLERVPRNRGEHRRGPERRRRGNGHRRRRRRHPRLRAGGRRRGLLRHRRDLGADPHQNQCQLRFRGQVLLHGHGHGLGRNRQRRRHRHHQRHRRGRAARRAVGDLGHGGDRQLHQPDGLLDRPGQ